LLRDKKVHRLAILSLLLAAALVAGLAERAIPFDFAVPGVKLGLGNVVILTALYLFPLREVWGLAILKCALTALLGGSFTSFAYSLAGSLLSLAAMALLLRIAGEKVGSVGVSAVGAVFHNIGQLLAASLVMGTAMVWGYLPWLLLSGVITGVITGLLAGLVVPRLRRIWGSFGG
jgi:heptaprenyl diphosphate synthase